MTQTVVPLAPSSIHAAHQPPASGQPIPSSMKATHPGSITGACPLPRRQSLAAAVMAALALWGAPAHAALTAVAYTIEADGTPGWDGSDGPGLDSGPRNGRVRTHDEVTYRVAISYSGGTKNARITLTLPKQADGTPMAEWPKAVEGCASGSSVSADRQTLTCVLDDFSGSGTQATDFRATILGTVANGTAMPAPTLQAGEQNAPAVMPPALPGPLTISAAPFYDVVIDRTYPGDPKAHAFQEAGGPGGRDGFYHRMLVGLLARNPGGHGKKGVEALDPGQPVTIDLDVSGYPQSVRLDNWRTAANTPNAADRPSGSFQTGQGCGSTWVRGSTPGLLAGGPLNMYQRVLDLGPDTGNTPTIVANGGTCVATRTADGLPTSQRVQIRISGIDTSLKHTPTHKHPSFAIDASDFWVSNKAVVFWTDIADYPVQQQIDHTLKLAAISARSLSGQPIQNVRTSNDSFTYPLVNQIEGRASKIWFPDTSLPLPEGGTVREPTYREDAIVDYMAPGQHVGSRISFSNRGSVAYRNIVLCEVIDRSAFDLGSNFSAWDVYNDRRGQGTVEYGVRPGSPYFASTDSASGPTFKDTSPGGRSDYSRATCNDPGIVWYARPEEARAAGGPTYIRATLAHQAGGKGYHLFVQGLKLRTTWASTVQVLAPQAGTRVQGEVIAENTVLRNRAWVHADNMPATEVQRFAALRDHLQVKRVRTITRVNNDIIAPAGAATQPVAAGQIVTFQLQPRYATLVPPQPGTVTVTDFLPAGLIYQAGSGTRGGQPDEPVVETDTATGQTKLTWTYDNVTPHFGPDADEAARLPAITFRAQLSRRLTNDSSVRNHAIISGGTADDVPDCTRDAAGNLAACTKRSDSELRISTPPGFALEKRTEPAQIEPGDPFTYAIDFYSMGRALQQVDIPDIIDILPHAGDGTRDTRRAFEGRLPASRFQTGAWHLVSVDRPAIDPGMEIYYTRRAPREIHNDPRDASNAIPGGSTRWCREAEFGTTGCPVTIADTTAVRTSPALASLPSNQPYGLVLHMASDPVIAQPGDLFANQAAARPDNRASDLLLALSDAGLNTRVVSPGAGQMAAISGRVFLDMDGQADSSAEHNRPLAGQCIRLSGTDDRQRPITLSTRTDADGHYSLAPDGSRESAAGNGSPDSSTSSGPLPQTNTRTSSGATGGTSPSRAIYPNGDCSGTALTHFHGIRGGQYTLSRITPTSQGNTAARPRAGSAGGDASSTEQLIGNISLKGGQAATHYDFIDVPPAPQLTLTATVGNTHGGSHTLDDVTLAATRQQADGSPEPATRKSGKSGDTAVTAATVTAGIWTLDSTSLPGYTTSGWTCSITRQGGEQRETKLAGTSPALPLLNGDRASCTITYADRPATLTLINTVTNSNGRSNTAADFDLSATGPLSGQNGGNGGSGNNGGSGGNGGNAGNGGNTGHGGNGGSGNGGSTQTAALSGKTGTPTVTSVQVLPGSYRLHATNLLDSDGKPIYVPGAWSCTVSTDDAAQGAAGGSASGATSNASGTVSGTTGSSAAGRTSVRDVTIITEDSGNAKKGDADVTLANGDNVVCTINHSDAPVSLSLKLDIINQYGGTATADDNTVSASGQGKEIRSPKKSESSDPVPVAPGVYRLTGLSLPGYQTGSWACDGGTLQDTYVTDGQTQNGPFLVTGNRANIGCRFTLKDIPASIRVEKSVAGEPALVAGTANEYTVQHIVTVTHQSGVDATYDLTDTPAFDPDVQIVSTQITLESDDGDDDAGSASRTGRDGQSLRTNDTPSTANDSRTGQTLSRTSRGQNSLQTLEIAPVTLANGTVQWPLASRRILKMQDTTTGHSGRHVYRMTSRIRVPFGSSTHNNRCTTGGATNTATGTAVGTGTRTGSVATTSAATGSITSSTGSATGGNGLHNTVSLTHYDGALQPINSTPLTSQACVDTPEPVESTTLVIEKSSGLRSVELGEQVAYRLRIRNTGNTPAIKPVVVDLLPRGFRFEPGSVRVQNATATNVEMTSNRELRITLDRIDMPGSTTNTTGNAGGGSSTTGNAGSSTAGNTATGTGNPDTTGSRLTGNTSNTGASSRDVLITYRLRAGVGSQEGDGINRAHIQCVAPRSPSGLADCSNESRWKVQVTGGIFSEEACLAGQIFVDCNGNSIKDREELGIPGVRLYLENGTWLVSDEQGKYSHCGLRPRTHVLKVDSRTLPRRSRLVTSSPQNVGDANSLFIDARKGMLHRADFIEGSCSNTVIEQVKARQAQGPSPSVQTEGPLPPAGSGATEKHHNTGTPLQQTQPALTFDSKRRLTSRPRQQGTDSARQPLSRTRY